MSGPTYTHFTIETLAPGVFAAIATLSGAAYSNAGIVDLGDRTLVFDTFDLPDAAEELRTAAEQLTGRAPGVVINSHVHGDHWSGNNVFVNDALIIGTQRMCDACPGVIAEEVTGPRQDPSDLVAEAHNLEAQVQATSDVRRRAMLERQLARLRRILQILPDFSLYPPALAFDGKLTFHGSLRLADLVASGGSHTPGDCYLLLSAERIVFLGDIAFFDAPPFMPPDCDLPHWFDLIEMFAQSSVLFFVPGHGQVGKAADLRRQKQYMLALRDMVAGAIHDGGTLKDVLRLPFPAGFDEWDAYSRRHENNLRSLYQLLSRGEQ